MSYSPFDKWILHLFLKEIFLPDRNSYKRPNSRLKYSILKEQPIAD